MSNDVLVRAEGLSKKFCRDLTRSLWYGVTDTLSDLAGCDGSTDKLRRSEFWALNDVSFELRRGECLGLMGRNGAGKTTLLKMLNGLIKPDRGRIEMHGRVGALIALGAGFSPILTGRENIYVNGAVLGLSKKEINSKFDEIVEFSELADFIDTPVQSYSSGMQVRLGFAVAAHIKPDVLLVDEVLAVGDVGFRIKCYNKIFEIRDQTATIFVSHSMPQIGKVCTSGLLMASGRAVTPKMPVGRAIQGYLDQFEGPKLAVVGNGAIEIKRVTLRQNTGNPRTLYLSYSKNSNACSSEIDPVSETILELDCTKTRATGPIVVLWAILDLEQKLVAQAFSRPLDHSSAPRDLRIVTKIDGLHLNTGRYTLNVNIYEKDDTTWGSLLGGLRDFAEISVAKTVYTGAAPILYRNETEVRSAQPTGALELSYADDSSTT